MHKQCWKKIDNEFLLCAVLDKDDKTFKWSLFKNGFMIDGGSLAEVAQIKPDVFISSFSEALIETYKTIPITAELFMIDRRSFVKGVASSFVAMSVMPLNIKVDKEYLLDKSIVTNHYFSFDGTLYTGNDFVFNGIMLDGDHSSYINGAIFQIYNLKMLIGKKLADIGLIQPSKLEDGKLYGRASGFKEIVAESISVKPIFLDKKRIAYYIVTDLKQ